MKVTSQSKFSCFLTWHIPDSDGNFALYRVVDFLDHVSNAHTVRLTVVVTELNMNVKCVRILKLWWFRSSFT